MNFSLVFDSFFTIIFGFLFELYLLYVFIVRKLKRKENFVFKFVIGLVLVLLFSFISTIFYVSYGDTVIGRVLVYSFIFISTIIHLYYCFDESIWSILLCSGLGYVVQNLIYKVVLTIWNVLLFNNLINYSSDHFMYALYYRSIYFVIFITVIFILYKVYLVKLHEKLYNCHLKYQLLIIAISVLFVTNILCSLEDVYFLNIDILDYKFYILRQTGNLFSVICCILVIILITNTLDKDSLKNKVDYLQHTIRASQRQYEISKDTINLINIKCHDIKYKIEASLNDKKEVNEIKEMIAIYDSNIATGNKLLDVLFTEKSLYCEQNNIKFSSMVDGEKLSFIEDGDLYCLFGNLTDNALEAVSKIPNEEKRIINIIVKVIDNMLIIQEDNYFVGNISFDEDGLPITSKMDKDYHGFGIQSIKLLVEKYKGVLTTYVNDDVFHLNILFNLNNLQNK